MTNQGSKGTYSHFYGYVTIVIRYEQIQWGVV